MFLMNFFLFIQYVTLATILMKHLREFLKYGQSFQKTEIKEHIEECYRICKFHHIQVNDNQMVFHPEITLLAPNN